MPHKKFNVVIKKTEGGIDANANVEFWVRNIERQEFHSFWLQTSTDNSILTL